MRSKMLCALAVTAGTLAAGPAASAAAPPANDAFETPVVLGDASVTGTLDEATRQAGEPEHGWRSVWYVHRPSKTGRIAVRLSPEHGWGAVTVYTGTSITALQRVGRALEHGYGARVAFDAVAGQEYRIVVANRCDGCSSSPFDLASARPRCRPTTSSRHARTHSDPGRVQGQRGRRNRRARRSRAAPALGLVPHQASPYGQTSPIDLEARTCGGDSMTLYTGNGLSEPAPGAERRPDPPEGRARGTAYRLVVDCTRPGLGDFVLSLSDGSIKGKGVKLAVTPDQTVDSVLANGLRMTVSAKRRVGVGIDLRVSPRRRHAASASGRRVLGRTSGAVDYGKSLPAVLRLTGAARRALADVEHLRGIVRLEILRTDAPNRVLKVPVRL